MRIHDVQVPISPVSKKCIAHDIVKKIKKKKKQLADLLGKLVVENDFESGSEGSPIRHDIGLGFETPQRDSPVKLNFEDTGSFGGNVHIYNMDTTTKLNESPSTTIPAKADLIPPMVSRTESITDEVQTLGILVNISDMEKKFFMGEGMTNNDALGISSIQTSIVHT